MFEPNKMCNFASGPETGVGRCVIPLGEADRLIRRQAVEASVVRQDNS